MTTRDSQDPPLSYEAERAEILATLRSPLFWLKVALIFGSALWIYRPIFNGDVLMDDDIYLTKNPLLNDPHRLWKAWFEPGSFIEYYPIEQSVQWVQFRFWGDRLLGYHLTNILLHALGALMVWRVLTKFRLGLAWVGGLLFAVHPAVVESVAWMAELKNVLALPFLLAAAGCYIEYENHGRRRDYFVALLAFVISMFCKISGAPFAFVILLYAWWRRGRVGLGDLKAAAPFFIVAVSAAYLTHWCGQVFAGANAKSTDMMEPELLARCVLAGGALLSYFKLAVWPFDLLPIYPQWTISPPRLWLFWPWLVVAIVAAVCWRSRASWGRHTALGLGFFVLTIAPFLGIIWISYMRFTWVMDHHVYIALIGPIGLAIALLDVAGKRLSPGHSIVPVAGALVLALIFAFNSRSYARHFLSQEQLWTYTIARNPKAWPAYNNLGACYLLLGHPEKTLPLAEKGLELNPRYGEASYNRALALERLGRNDDALKEYKRTIELVPSEPMIRFSHARLLEKQHQWPEAIEEYRAGQKLAPSSAAATHGQVGSLLARMGRLTEAEKELNEAVTLTPGIASYHCDLGNVLFLTGRPAQAIEQYRRAAELDPLLPEAHNDLAGALQHTGHPDQAIEEYEKAVRLEPDNPWVLTNLASAMVDAGRKDEAVRVLQTALHYVPNYPPAMAQLKALREKAHTPSPAK